MLDPRPTPDRRTLRIFLQSGFVWQLCWSSYWTLFFIRVVVDVGLDPLELLLLGTPKEVTLGLVARRVGIEVALTAFAAIDLLAAG